MERLAGDGLSGGGGCGIVDLGARGGGVGCETGRQRDGAGRGFHFGLDEAYAAVKTVVGG